MRVRILGPGEQPAEGETELALQNTSPGTLHIGILEGEYMRVPPSVSAAAPTRFAPTADQLGRYQFQLRVQPIYQGWFAQGLLIDITAPAAPPPEE